MASTQPQSGASTAPVQVKLVLLGKFSIVSLLESIKIIHELAQMVTYLFAFNFGL
jgi:hypothetical protein